ncbi:MAG TPA: GNAT family N-acetyltransferase, partial [Micrococcaceae bacterium]
MSPTTQPPAPFPYQLRRISTALKDGAVPEELDKWNQAVLLGFHAARAAPEAITQFVASGERDGQTVTGAYQDGIPDGIPDGAWDNGFPVATYATYTSTLNIGAGRLLPCHLVTAVTVRPSHRRRGLLRTMITTDLARAKDAGLPMAALTASEAGIYGRFGFGVATHAATVEVETGPRFALRNAPAGRVETVDPGWLEDLGPRVFGTVHGRTPGS